ncbi:MAG: adenosine deaminase [Solidesulfovibrio magneticus str. Maddingley MBC34]|uniref:adenosine deaminase n=1 Tax=Solidesulfovibrio magneticus str. Maddingley MBC34 TaxID=1206767 RepID=K6HBS3_9BACT|nr:MAG: adenosine deaminase [Solidesulfovibrio magneticus str. Maddingley MBC34]
MDIDRLTQALNILLTRVPAHWLRDSHTKPSLRPVNKQAKIPFYRSLFDTTTFERAYLAMYPSYGGNEARLAYKYLHDSMALSDNKDHGLFWLIRRVARHFLKIEGHEILCRHELLIPWRETVRYIGQSTLMCALAAHKDLERRNHRVCNFSPYAKSDNLRLRQLLAMGMAENHFHLKGSAPAFLVSWVCLMNRVIDRAGDFNRKEMKHCMCPERAVAPGNNGDLRDWVTRAAYIRYWLWNKLQSAPNSALPPSEKTEAFLGSIVKHLALPNFSILNLQHRINTLRVMNNPRSLDYTCDTTRDIGPYAAIAGEHTFQYLMFKAIYSDDDRVRPYLDLYYLYLLIAFSFRMELVQANKTVGFDNFHKYQNRKEIFVERFPAYSEAFLGMAYATNLGNKAVKSFEARVTPGTTVQKLHRAFNILHRIIEARQPGAPHISPSSNRMRTFARQVEQLAQSQSWRPVRQPRANPLDERVFHVLHFIKEEDQIDWRKPFARLACMARPRHYRLRVVKLEKMAEAITSWRHGCSREAANVYGIDACSQEIHCRPEVFAPAFRRLRQDMHYPWYWGGTKIRPTPPVLHISYHVGEDFLDIVDGLRAIDESILYLELTHGDRLGHALALGVDARDWYNFKGDSVILRKQDLLDNLMWFYHKICEYGIVADKLLRELSGRFSMLFHEIYSQKISVANTPATIDTYYGAWKLRGDHPIHYAHPTRVTNALLLTAKRCNILPGHKFDLLRRQTVVRELIHRYHYNALAKERGEQITTFKINSDYVSAVKKLQQRMQETIAREGIAIETNPTSNYLIGTFGAYDKHPIIRFYDRSLTDSPSPQQLFVSINTDDQGVFDTDLESEYAIMASALEQAKDENGKFIYKPANIYAWIDDVRAMGMLQSFKNIETSL